MLAAATFGTNLIIFPHYQAFARESFGLAGIHLLHWVIIQQIAVGVFSLLIGLTADRWGNRLTLQLVVFGAAAGPGLAAAFSWLPQQGAAPFFWIIFVALAIVPMVLRILTNYTLEICAIGDQPRYLSTVNLSLACSFILAPFAGWLVDAVGFRFVFLTVMAFNILSGLITLGLIEPRHSKPSSSSASS
jgi:MFS family permease